MSHSKSAILYTEYPTLPLCTATASCIFLFVLFLSVFSFFIKKIDKAKRHNKSEKLYPKHCLQTSETFCISDIKTYCWASFDIWKPANRVGFVCCNYPLQCPTTQLKPIVIADQCQSISIIVGPYQTFTVIAKAALN